VAVLRTLVEEDVHRVAAIRVVETVPIPVVAEGTVLAREARRFSQ
jgi:hypothetical protein